MNNKINPLLTELSNTIINKFHIDTKNDSIKLGLTNNIVSEITFNDVVSFYYTDNEDDINIVKNDITSLNNIMYCENNTDDFIHIPVGDDITVSVPNFVLELSDSSVFIEATSITIDKETYTVQ